jgi:hypothetical protein
MLFYTEPLRAEEEVFNNSYPQHIWHLLGLPGFKSAIRYRLAPLSKDRQPRWITANRYLAIYELVAREGGVTSIVEGVRSNPDPNPIRGLDRTRTGMQLFERIGEARFPR